MRRKDVILLPTATPSNVEPEITTLERRGDVHVSAEGKLAIHAIPDKDKDHGAKHLGRRFPDSFSGMSVSIISIVTLQHTC
jgi:hypothetical protein